MRRNKDKGKGESRTASTSSVTAGAQLYAPAWPSGSILQINKLNKSLEEGISLPDCAMLCGSVSQVENLRRLAKLQRCQASKVALVTPVLLRLKSKAPFT